MSMYGLPDPTGINPLFLVVNQPFHVYQSGIKLHFEASPIFSDSLIIALSDGTGRQLAKGIDWEVRSDDVDQAAMSKAFLEDLEFKKTLVKSVTLISELAVGKHVAATFQNYYLTIPGRTFDDGTPFEVTPDLIKEQQRNIAELMQRAARTGIPTTPNFNAPKLLPFDINGQRPGNKIVNEKITVNTIAGAAILLLSQGAFFKDSLTITYNGQTLSPTSDYQVVNLATALTGRSTNKSGIYHNIQLTGAFAGDVYVTYQAVGGEVQQDDLKAIYEQQVAILTFLNQSLFVTADSLSSTVAFQATHARLVKMEEQLRILLSGSPSYGDVSGGTAVVRPINTTDADMHWWSIATLFKVQGSNDIIRADAFKGRIHLPGSKLSLDFTVDVNIDQVRNVADFTTQAVVFDPTYELFDDISVSPPVLPLVRIVWNQASESYSGIVLQVGFPVLTLSDQMVVENLSSSESCWLLVKPDAVAPGQPVPAAVPNDTNFLLPDSVSMWSDVASISHSRVFVPTYEKGYLVYSGAQVTIANLVTVENTGNRFNVTLPDYFPIEEIKALVVTVISEDSSELYNLEIPLDGLVDTKRMGRVTFADTQDETLSMAATLTQDNLGNIALSLNCTSLAVPLLSGTPSTKTDLVRYVRARV